MTLTALTVSLAACLLSFALAWFICQKLQNRLIEQQQQELDAQHQQLQALNLKNGEQLSANNRLQVALARFQALQENEQSKESEQQQALKQLKEELNVARIAQHQAEQECRIAQTRLEEQQQHNQKAIAQLEANKEALKQEFKHLAHDIFEARGSVLSAQHNEQLSSLLAPFKEQLSEFRNKLESAHQDDSNARAALKQQLETVVQLNQKITEDAQNLTKALKGDKKLQGNWGEMQVETILESSGLIKGQEFEREPNFKNDDGQNRRPDFIVRLPEGKHLIIDSKVSLVDYLNVVSAEDDTTRQAAITAHIQSIRNHINALSQKDYPHLEGMKAPDFVFMFMPIEPAFITAFQHDSQLFNDAFAKRIVVVTPTTLLATLRTVANLWTIERQNSNAQKLADKGRAVYDKLRIFVEKMEKLDTQLNTARNTYDDAMSSLKHGQGNLIAQASQFLELGVRVKKELPEKTLQTADLAITETASLDDFARIESEVAQLNDEPEPLAEEDTP